MRLIRFLGKTVAVAFLMLVARRRRLQKLRFRLECLRQELALKEDQIEGLTEQRDSFRDALSAIRSESRLRDVAAKTDIAMISNPR